MKVWAVANQKGGVGKTTTAVTLAGLLANRGNKTLLIDLDPHGSLTTYFGNDPDSVEHSVYDVFQDNQQDVHAIIQQTSVDNLYVLPASTALATLDRQLATQQGKGLVIHTLLQQLESQYDNVILDCPPMLGVLMVNALAACEYLIIPVQTEFLALKGLERMLRTVAMINRTRKEPLPYHIVPTMFDRRTRASLKTLEALQEKYTPQLWNSVIPVDTKFREASQAGVPLSSKVPGSHGALAYADLLDSITGFIPAEMSMATVGQTA